MGILIKNIIKFKKKKDYINTFKLDIIMTENIKGEKIIILVTLTVIKIIKKLKFLNLINIIINRRNLNFNSSNLLYNFRITILLLKEENKLFIL